MKNKKIKVEDAVGTILCHDITQIIPGEFKGRAFKKGHCISESDIIKLKSLGKNNIHVVDLDPDEIHEDDAATVLAEVLSKDKNNIEFTEPYESRVNLFSKVDGLLKINKNALYDINSLDDVVASTISNYSIVKKGEMIAGTKVIPLVVKKQVLDEVKKIGKREGDVLRILPFQPIKAGIVITGTEVYNGIIKDAFKPVLTEKVEKLGGTVSYVEYAPDDENQIKDKILKAIEAGCNVILVSGGMSVDADDVTPKAIRSISRVVRYGSPVLPGAMFMMGYAGDIPVIGIPACGMYTKVTVFDLIYPRVAAGEVITKADIISLANGGLCRKCPVCTFPNCSFGRG